MEKRVYGMGLGDIVDAYKTEKMWKGIIRAVIQVMMTVIIFNILGLGIVGQIIGITLGLMIVERLNSKKVEQLGIYGMHKYLKVDDKYLDIELMSSTSFEYINKENVVYAWTVYYLLGVGFYGLLDYFKVSEGLVSDYFILGYFLMLVIIGIVGGFKYQVRVEEWYYKNIDFLLAQYMANKRYMKQELLGEISEVERIKKTDSFLTWFYANYVLDLDEGTWTSGDISWGLKDEEEFNEIVDCLGKISEDDVKLYTKLDIMLKEELKDVKNIKEMLVRYVIEDVREVLPEEEVLEKETKDLKDDLELLEEEEEGFEEFAIEELDEELDKDELEEFYLDGEDKKRDVENKKEKGS